MSFFDIGFTLFVIFNPIGNVPVLVALLRQFDVSRQRKIIIRELLFALILMLVFCFFGDLVLDVLRLNIPIVRMAGGILLFMIAFGMVFHKETQAEVVLQQEPFIVPIATPILAGPATLSTVMVFAAQEPSQMKVLLGVLVAWVPALAILLLASFFKKILGDKILLAFEQIAGLILIYIAIQMFGAGLSGYAFS